MASSNDPASPSLVPMAVWWMVAAALAGLAASTASAWVHHRVLTDPTYASFCDVGSSMSCTNAYTSPFGAFAGVSVALLGVIYFAGVLLVLAGAIKFAAARATLLTCVFLLAVVGLGGVFYLGYASFFILRNVCLLCVATYVAVTTLFVSAALASRTPMRLLPSRFGADVSALFRAPSSALASAGFVAVSLGAIAWFPEQRVAAAVGTGAEQAAAQQTPAALPALPASALQELEKFMAAQQRVPVVVASDGAAVVLVKFNDYMCPPCGQTFAEYKPVLAKWMKEYPGKLKFVSKDYPLDPECNRYAPGGAHMASCEAAVAVRLAREKNKAAEMEDWLFANQPTLTPPRVKEAARIIGGVSDFDARYAATLQLVKGDIEQGGTLKVAGTPTFFMNGIRLPGLRPEFLDAAIALEMKRAGVSVR